VASGATLGASGGDVRQPARSAVRHRAPKPAPGSGEIAHKVAGMLTRGMSQDAIATALNRSRATINWHARRMSVTGERYDGRAFIARVLGYSGVRNSELCDLRIRHVRLHGKDGARFNIPDAKTETGIRVVEMSPDLAEAFVAHLDRLRRAGQPVGLDDYLVRNRRGGRISRQRIAEIIREAALLANETRERQGLPPLPRTTPHSLVAPTSRSRCRPTTSTSSGS
jgi:integrase